MEREEWRIEYGEWNMENREWRVVYKDGIWRMENVE